MRLQLAAGLALCACASEARISLLPVDDPEEIDLRGLDPLLGGGSSELGFPSPLPAADQASVAIAGTALVLRYDFEGEGTRVEDRVGEQDGVVLGGGALDGTGMLELDGVDDYVDLPNGILSDRASVTIVVWLRWHGGTCWQRVFDFGSSDAGEDRVGQVRSSLFLTPASCPDGVLMSMTERFGDKRSVRAASALAADRETQVALVIDAERAESLLYVDGELAGTSSGIHAMSGLEDVNNWLGRSQWVQDYYLRASYDELRIYDRALGAAAVAELHARGADWL